jgi:hypothetical protein
MAAGPDDQQLIRIVQHLAKLHLEIERGVRDPDQLTTMMRPEAQLAWRRTRPHGITLPGGPATDADLGPISLRRASAGDVFASVTTTTLPGRRGALTFVLHVDNRQVTIRQAKRLNPGLDYGSRTTAGGDPVADRLAAALEERRAVKGAMEAGERLAAETAPSRRAPPPARWQTVLAQLDIEITTLMRTDLQRHFDGHDPSRYRAAGSRKSR